MTNSGEWTAIGVILTFMLIMAWWTYPSNTNKVITHKEFTKLSLQLLEAEQLVNAQKQDIVGIITWYREEVLRMKETGECR